MNYFYDAQIKRYLTQTIRFFSNFLVRYDDGTLKRIPVIYGDPDRQAANIIRQNSENSVVSAPKIAIYITELSLDRDRLGDQTFVSTMHFRERAINKSTGSYTSEQGRNYTVERIMPTPFKLTMKIDIWSTSTDQKLQILEQILTFFNPSLELQTSDNYIDCASLSVLNLSDLRWSSRSVPVGTQTPIDIATLTVDTPIWLSPPVKVKQLGVITNIITSLFQSSGQNPTGYIEGLGIDTAEPTVTMSSIISQVKTAVISNAIAVYGNTVTLIGDLGAVIPRDSLSTPSEYTQTLDWNIALDEYHDKFISGVSTINLQQPNGSYIIGTVSINQSDTSKLDVNWFTDTFVSNTGIDSQGRFDTDTGYNPSGSFRPNSPGTFDAIIDPLTFNPKRPNGQSQDQTIPPGTRYLIVDDINNTINQDGSDAWKSSANVDFIANANDIIEWSGSNWTVIFNSKLEADTMIWQTNIFTGIQYIWDGVSWSKSYDGIYYEGEWRLIM